MIRSAWQRVHAEAPFGADSAITLGANLAIGLEGAVSGIMAARLLGPEGRGELAAIQTFSGFVAAIATMGMIEAVVYYCARDAQKAGSYMVSAATIALVASVPVLVIAYFLMPVVLAAQSYRVIRAARWYLLMAPVCALVSIPAHALRGRADFVAWNGVRVIPNFNWIVVLASASWFACRNACVLAIAYLAAQAAVFVPVSFIVAKRVPGPFRAATSDWPGMIRYGFPCSLTNFPQIINLRLDQIVLSMLVPARQLGIYAVAVAWSGVATPLLNAVGAALLPIVAKQSDRPASTAWFAKGMRFASFLAAATCLLLIAVTPISVVTLFGINFQSSVPAALVLVSATSLLALNSVLEQGLLGLGQPYSVLGGELAGLFATVLALSLTVRRLGIMSGALSSLAGYLTVFVALVLRTSQLTRLPARDLLWPRRQELHLGMLRVRSLVRTLAAGTD
jgi:O-antigen/teichoic acid export membrane protein